ncbi:hypothetical protein BMS3Bbin02_00802 [bacterium BMS3Bbin02]|nr:hypothetical protein BMS3Bbin02_00802 [bacterium BMS3Bbin02]
MNRNDIQGIRDAFELIVLDAPEAPDFDRPFRVDSRNPSLSNQPRRWLVVIAAAATVLVTIGVIPFLVNSGGGVGTPSAEEATVATTTAANLGPVWPPAPSDVDPPPGASWVCPPIAPGSKTTLTGNEIPTEVRYLPAMPMKTTIVQSYGPACGRTPALVAMNFVDGQRSSADAAVVVWVESPSAKLNEPPAELLLGEPTDPLVCYENASDGSLACFPGRPSAELLAELSAETGAELLPTTRSPSDAWTLVERNGFTIRARNEANGRIDMVGVIDGLPVWIEASGIDTARLETLVQQMTADAVTGQVTLPVSATGIEVMHSAPVIAEVVQKVVLRWETSDVDGEVWDGEVWLQQGYIPYTIAAFSVDGFRFTTVGDTVAVFAREGGGTGGLRWEVAPGVVAMMRSDASLEQMIAVAESFERN